MRKIFPIIVKKLMKKDKRIFCLLGDIGVHSFREVFKNYKNRILNMSTMEQSMIGFSSGLSKSGYIPIVHTIAPFLVLRALEQIKIDLVYNKLACNIVSVGASNDYSKLGTTHHCFEDVNILSNYNKINIFIPSNSIEFDYLFRKYYKNNSINYFRLSNNNLKFYRKNNGFLIRKNNGFLIILIGNSIDYQHISIKFEFDVYYINQISKDIRINFIKKYKKVIIIEPYFGNVLERIINQKYKFNKSIKTISYQETILHKYGKKSEQDNFLKFNQSFIKKKANEFFKK
jgi:transketolase